MIIQRFARALKNQDWITVMIEFLLVVFGVLIALEVDRYNEDQNKRAEEVRLLKSVQQELQQDIVDIDKLMVSLRQVDNFGKDALKIINTTGCIGDCWENLVSIFHSTQWIDVGMSTTAYEELSQLGLPKNPTLKSTLREYYDMNKNRVVVSGGLPQYRELIRSLITPDMQDQMWSNCFETKGRHQILKTNCPPGAAGENSQEVVELIQSKEQVKMSLTFWMSTLSVTILITPQQRVSAVDLLVALENEIKQ